MLNEYLFLLFYYLLNNSKFFFIYIKIFSVFNKLSLLSQVSIFLFNPTSTSIFINVPKIQI